MFRSTNVPVFIKSLALNKKTGHILLHAELPLYLWPDGRKLPNYRSSYSRNWPEPADYSDRVITTVQLVDYVMPLWQTEMPQGVERYELYLKYERLIRAWVLQHVQSEEPWRLQPSETESDWLKAEDFWILTPKAESLALGAGIPWRQPQPQAV